MDAPYLNMPFTMRSHIFISLLIIALYLTNGTCNSGSNWRTIEDQSIKRAKIRQRASMSANYILVPAGSVSTFVPRQKETTRRRYRRSTIALKPNIVYLEIDSTVQTRYSDTEARSELSNNESQDVEGTFIIYLPQTCFISNFTMTIDGVLYVAKVKSKAQAKQEYEDAKKQKKTAGHVAVDDNNVVDDQRDMEIFTISVNVASMSTAQFSLSFIGLLQRELGTYNHIISIRPGQPVPKLTANINVYESETFTSFTVIEPHDSMGHVTITPLGNNIKNVYYEISLEDQLQVNKTKGVDGNLVIKYDIPHQTNDAGLFVRDAKYFCHYFSPSGLTVLSKRVVFVVDNSGSMSGGKIQQAKDAMVEILKQLITGDWFQIVKFDTEIELYTEGLLPVSETNIKDAQDFVKRALNAAGLTNINEALVKACHLITDAGSNENLANLIVFLTDGQPSTGITNPDQIVKNTVRACGGVGHIYSLGFGFDLDFELLKVLSGRTGGIAKRIYVSSDATVQLQNFFKTIAQPLLIDVHMDYSNMAVPENLTLVSFPSYFEGSELVVCGQLKPNPPLSIVITVIGLSDSTVTMVKTVNTAQSTIPSNAQTFYIDGFTEKLWAYMYIKYLEHLTLGTNNEQQEKLWSNMGTELAISMNLVTPYTSFVIVQPDNSDTTNIVDRTFVRVDPPFLAASSQALSSYINSMLSLAIAFMVLIVKKYN